MEFDYGSYPYGYDYGMGDYPDYGYNYGPSGASYDPYYQGGYGDAYGYRQPQQQRRQQQRDWDLTSVFGDSNSNQSGRSQPSRFFGNPITIGSPYTSDTRSAPANYQLAGFNVPSEDDYFTRLATFVDLLRKLGPILQGRF